MESFRSITGTAVPFLEVNVDTDQIIPANELVRARKEGCGPSLFANRRYLRDRQPNPDFILNREPWKHAVILLADRNFGCGSSREHAAKAMREFGFRVVIAPSFGGIFFSNCFRNGVLPVELPIDQVHELADDTERSGGEAQIEVSLESQAVTSPKKKIFRFASPQLLRAMLLEGIDEVDLTLTRRSDIDAFRAVDRMKRPWAYCG